MDSSESDVVVWTESEERHAWWCEVLGITVAGSYTSTEVWELPASVAPPIVSVPTHDCQTLPRVVDAA
ncbi:hypothetical protein [Rhodococcus qingshengii]|uniref:hypothetical protein n=1 Tax=Rhodococcus qingshengii TaxID=334542 RepID=UPI001BEBCAE5|nr:hypothetical protein [Rhodococcus qingshengii]MBT2272212.1 hypothetical protein [Rhodococcus qingshengii]